MANYISIILPLLSAILVFVLGLIVYIKNKKSLVNIIFFLHALAITVWLFGTFMMFFSRNNYEVAIFWDRFVYLGVVFIPIFMYHFSIAFTKVKNQQKLLIVGYVLAFIFLIASRTDYFVSDLFVYQWGVHTKAQILHHVFLFNFFFFILILFYNIYNFYKQTFIPNKKTQARYVLLAFFLLVSIGSLAYLPAYGIGIYPFAYISGVLFTLILSYAIIRHRLMDIRLVIKRSTIFTLLVLTMTALYAFVVIFLSGVFEELFDINSMIVTGAFSAVLVAFGFEPLKKILQQTTDSFLFKDEYDASELLHEVGEILSTTLNLKKLLNNTINLLINAFRNSKMAILFFYQERGCFVTIAHHLFGEQVAHLEFDTTHPVAKYFALERKIVILDELKRHFQERVGDNSLVSKVIAALEDWGVAVAMPLFNKDQLVGFFFLDNKKSGDVYTTKDINVLEISSVQAATAIQNAKFYEEVRGFNVKLEVEIKRATDDLREANRELKKLDQVKSEFISIASHQLRTPLTVIKGYISMMLEGSFGKLTTAENESLKKVYASNERLIRLVEDLLNISRIESGRLEFSFENVQLTALVKNITEELEAKARFKKLYLRFQSPQKELPLVSADSQKMHEVISNLIDNSIQYTRKGGITVRVWQDKDKIKFSISDTGIGILASEKKILFKKFSRGKGMALIHTEGTGLGLYVAKEIVKAHHGTIQAESPGRDQGSTFTVSLQALKPAKIAQPARAQKFSKP